MKDNSQNLYISVESLRNRITSRLIPLLFAALLITMFLSFARIPTMGFHVIMVLHVFLLGATTILYFARKRIRPDASALVMVGILSLLLISGVATLGLLSAAFVLGPIISLYLMLLGHRKSAYASIVLILVYLSAMAVLFVSGLFEFAASPNIYVRSSIAWMIMIAAVGGVSVAFVAPLELVPGVLEGSEERFRLAFENANVGICLTSLEGRLLKVNDALCEMLGYHREELEQMSVSDITYKDDRETSLTFIKEAPQGGSAKINFEKRYIHKRGNIIWADVSSSLNVDSRGNSQYFITHIQNVTIRKQAEDALRASEERMRAIVEGTPHLFFYTQDAQGNTTYVSPTVEQITGYKSDVWLQREDWFVTDAKFNQAAKEKTYAHLRGEFTKEPVLLEVRHAAGNPILLEAYEYPIIQNGKVVGLQGVAHDITERKRAEEALRESEAKLRAMFESSKDAIGVSKKGVHIYANPSYLKLFGFENNESIIGTSIIDSIAPSHRQQMIENVERRFAGKPVPKFYEARGMKVDGTEFDAEFNVSTYELHGEIYSLAIIRDITERKRAEEALRQSMEQLHALTMRLENVREEERKSVSREVHDELGQTLTALRMDLMSLKKMEATNTNIIGAKLQSMLDLTTNAIKSVQDISARLRPGMLDDLGLVSAIEWQTEEFQKRSGISCTLRLPDHDLEVDDERSTVLFRILQEALTNVARHAQAEHITVSLLDSKNEIVMAIHDDGIGIEDESVKNPKSLGLLGIRERLHPFQGSCSIQRGVDRGTEMLIQLPIRSS